jgi:predicted Zn-ribbon and HTH transcriptional regulator
VVRLAHSGVFSVEAVGANGAAFLYSGRQLAITLRTVEEGKGQLELLTAASENSHDEQLMAAFVAKHLYRRAISGTVVVSEIAACNNCGFVFSDSMLDALSDVESFHCPRCGTTSTAGTSLEDAEEGADSPDIRGLERTADDETARAAARTAVQGKDEIQEFDVFLAHSSIDKPSVRILATALRDVNVNPWLDEDEIPPGRWFQDVIQEVIPRVRAAAVIVGPEGLGRWEALELRTFISQCVSQGLAVIPVVLPGAEMPPGALFLRELNGVTFVRTLEEVEPFARLVWGITGDRALFQRLRARQL